MGVELISRVISDSDWTIIARRLKVSPQQRDIMRLIIVEDFKAEAIARRLGIAVSSVNTQLERLYAKLGVHTRLRLFDRVLTEFVGIRGWIRAREDNATTEAGRC